MNDKMAGADLPALSVITTAFNEEGNVDEFLDECGKAFSELGIDAEIIYINDGSTDATGDRVRQYIDQHQAKNIRLITHSSCLGITSAIQQSFDLAQGKYLCYLPADMESHPAEDIPALFNAMDEQTDVVVGSRKGRKDGKRLASYLYNRLNTLLFGINLKDANWIKLLRREIVEGVHLKSDWHRFFIPILAHGGARIKEVETQWYPRHYGKTNFGLKRFPVSLSDIISLKVHLSFKHRPLLFFILVSGILFFLALLLVPLAVFLMLDGKAALLWSGVYMAIVSMASLLILVVGVAVEMIIDNLNHNSGSP